MRNSTLLLSMLAVLLLAGTAQAELIGIPIHENATVPSGTFDNTAAGTNADPYVIAGAGGHDLWGNHDNIFMVYDNVKVSGDLEITARVNLDISGGGWTRAGLIVRETLDTGSRHFSALIVDSADRLTASHRHDTNGGTGRHSPDPFLDNTLGPTWLKITRNGNVFESLYSVMDTDDVNAVNDWARIGAGTDADRTVDMAADVYIGFQTHGRNNNNVDLTTASYWNLGGAFAVPEPGTLMMLLGGVVGLALLGRRRRR